MFYVMSVILVMIVVVIPAKCLCSWGSVDMAEEVKVFNVFHWGVGGRASKKLSSMLIRVEEITLN